MSSTTVRVAAMLPLLLSGLIGLSHPTAAQTSLTAALSLHDPVTGEPMRADGGEPVRLRVALTDPATGLPPRGVALMGWVRPADANNARCDRAAQNFRATRKIPVGSIDLNGILIASLNRDHSLSVIDPKLNLYSSNLVAAHLMEAEPAAMAVDARTMRALFAVPDKGEIVAAQLSGPGQTTIASALPKVTSLDVTSGGDIWAGTEDGVLLRLAPEGRILDRHELSAMAVDMRQQPDTETEVIGAFSRDGAVMMANGSTGRILMKTTFAANIADASFIGETGVIAVLEGAPVAALRYADAPDAAIEIDLGTPFARIETGPDQRIGIAYTPGEALIVLIDLALGRVVQSLALEDATVSAVAFTDNAAFVLSHDGGFLAAIDLATVAIGKPAVLRRVNLGAKSNRPEDGDGLLVPLFPSPQILAVEPENQTGWLVGEVGSSVAMPPMDSIRLRGGVPRHVAMVDRSLKEVAPGTFETVWAFPPGEHELVLTTYLGQLSTCVPFSVRGDVERQALTPVLLRAVSGIGAAPVGEGGEIAFQVVDPAGNVVPIQSMTILVPSMVSGWAGQAVAKAGTDGILRAQIALPHAGLYAVQPLDLPGRFALSAAMIVDAQDPGSEASR